MACLKVFFRFVLTLAVCATTPGQDLSHITGTILDASGAAIAGANVEITNPNRTLQQRTQTDRLGVFTFASVPPGSYRIKIDDRRFEPVQKNVFLSSRESAPSFRFELTIRRTRQEITVQERAEENSRYEVSQDTAALKTNESLLLTPQSVQVVPRAVLEDQNALTLTDAVRNVAGVTTDFGFNGSTQPLLILRGFQTTSMTARGGMSGMSSYYLDGTKVQGIPVNMANVQSVEVVKGPTTVLYGRAEPGGLVNVVSRPMTADAHYGLEQTATQFGANRSLVEVDHRLNRSGIWLGRFAGSWLYNRSNRDFVRDELGALTGQALWRPDARSEVSFNLDYTHQGYRNDYGIPADGNRPANVPWSRQYNNANELSTVGTKVLRVNAQHQWSPNWTVSGRVVSLWGSFFENDLTPYRLDLVGGGDCFALRGELCRYYFYVRPDGGNRLNQTNVDLKGRVQTGWFRHEMLVGFDYYNADRSGASYFQPVSPISVFNPVFTPVAPLNTSTVGFQTIDRTRWASGYLQDIVALGAHVRLMASVRFDGTSAIYAEQGTKPNEQNFVTPRFGAVWEFARGHSFYGQYQDAVDANNGRNPANGQELAAERSRQVEAGYKLSAANGAFNLTAAAYRLTKRNRADYSLFPFIQTLGEARSRGLELDALGRLSKRVATMASYSFIDAVVTRDPQYQGTRLADVPRHSGSVWLRYLATERWAFGGGVFSQSIRQGNQHNSFQLPGYARLDAMASYQFHLREWRSSLQLNVNNLLDRRYYTGSHQFVDDWIQVSAPRTFALTWRMDR